ncbi:MAG TPA: hypothetical protein VMC85_03280 [Desulfomonilaceae bacterium]|nr:hypothetical protein [Desulfomonilaceae bacterium]
MTRSRPERRWTRCRARVATLAGLILVVSVFGLLQAAALAQTTQAGTGGSRSESVTTSPATQPIEKGDSGSITDQRIQQLEQVLESIRITGEKAESRSSFIKMVSYELVSYLRWIVAALIAIAVCFPVTIWLMSRKRILGLSGFSDELAATLLMVEERQAKLANILKEIQGEVDYLHTMSVPDLKSLIAQAEKYLEQNERDLEKAGGGKGRSGGGPESTPPRH